ncbi:hypothetical protein [Klebsiella quasipneumoniae]|uniref:hypothetical protein n=1 Tax=Klebsiella quasipneumoniae TaxID=1463165 RepID=UPI0022E89E5A|nr:hypothetical protein [Klebsiella quasipneumoniae]
MKTCAVITLVTAALLLSGCNSEPSEQEIYNAMNKVVAQTNAVIKSMAGNAVTPDMLRTALLNKSNFC